MTNPPSNNTSQRPWQILRYWAKRLRHNFAQKLLALLAAAVCWYFATEDRRATIQQRYEVAVSAHDNTHSGEKRAVSSLSPASVQVTLSGTRQRLSTVNAGDIEAYVDVTDLPEGPFSRRIRVDGPDNTRSVQVTPATAQGQIDAQRSRRQPIVVSTVSGSNTLAGGALGVTNPRYLATPAQTTISGPSRLVSSVAQVVTAPINLAQGEQQQAHLLALDVQGQPVGVTLKPASVSVQRTDTGSLPIHSVPVQLSAVPANLKVTAAQITPPRVRLLGPVSPNLVSVRTQVPYRVGTYTVQPNLQLPPGLYSLDRVTVRLTVAQR